MVMPVETACPCRTKFIAMPCPGGLLLLAFAELIAYQLQDCVDRSLRVGAVRLDRDARALARREHHHPHDAFRVDPAPVARDPDVAGEGARRLRQLRRGARVQAELVDDLRGRARHCSTGRCSCARRRRRRPRAPSPRPRLPAPRGARGRAPASAGWRPRGPRPCPSASAAPPPWRAWGPTSPRPPAPPPPPPHGTRTALRTPTAAAG